jgi:hypothetical protein
MALTGSQFPAGWIPEMFHRCTDGRCECSRAIDAIRTCSFNRKERVCISNFSFFILHCVENYLLPEVNCVGNCLFPEVNCVGNSLFPEMNCVGNCLSPEVYCAGNSLLPELSCFGSGLLPELHCAGNYYPSYILLRTVYCLRYNVVTVPSLTWLTFGN